MRNRYRFSRSEERTNLKKSISFIFFSIVLLVLLYFFGIPMIARLASFVGDFGATGKSVLIGDSVPPGPPSFDSLPKATNNSRISIKGRSEPGSTVEINLNNKKEEITSNADGEFTISLDLNKGGNTIWAIAKDTAGNTSQSSESINIAFDNTAPTLNVESPAEGAEHRGETERQISIQGKTDPGVEITVNGRFVNVGEEGSFSYPTSLSDGENKFDIKALDEAQNLSEKTLTVNFTS